MKFPMRIYIKEYVKADDWFWRSLCIVYCNENLGLMERILQRCEMECKAESVEQAFMADKK